MIQPDDTQSDFIDRYNKVSDVLATALPDDLVMICLTYFYIERNG